MECKRVWHKRWCEQSRSEISALAQKCQDERRMARFAQYAMVASEEALSDAGWYPNKEDDLEATVWDSG
jgi:3-oxoacyl-(acyl-carrier-protein) synthase